MTSNKEKVRFKFVKLVTDHATGFKWCVCFDSCLCQDCMRLLTNAEAGHLAELLDKGASEASLDWFVHGVY